MQEIGQTKDGGRPDSDQCRGGAGLNEIWALEDPAISGSLPSDEQDPRRYSADVEWR